MSRACCDVENITRLPGLSVHGFARCVGRVWERAGDGEDGSAESPDGAVGTRLPSGRCLECPGGSSWWTTAR